MAKPDSPSLANVVVWANSNPWAVVLGETFQQHRFHSKRRWRFDLAWPKLMLAFECEGGVFVGGRHTRGAGFTGDCEKYSHAAALGWAVIRGTTGQIESGLVYPILEYAAKCRSINGECVWHRISSESPGKASRRSHLSAPGSSTSKTRSKKTPTASAGRMLF